MKIKKRKTKFDSADKRFIKLILILLFFIGTIYFFKCKIVQTNNPIRLEKINKR